MDYYYYRDNLLNELFYGEEKMSYRSLRKNVEKKTFHDILGNSTDIQKALLVANRSAKAMAYSNTPIGIKVTDDYKLNNQQWDVINKIRLDRNLISPHDKQKCKRCGILMDPKGRHAFECREGFNQIAHHDSINRFIVENQKGDLVVELEPRVNNEDGSAKKPDII